jgi:hypothetical protein
MNKLKTELFRNEMIRKRNSLEIKWISDGMKSSVAI